MSDQETSFVLRAKARDVRTVAALLGPIAFTKICQVNVSEAGLQVTTELNGVLQANAYIGRTLFEEYHFNAETADGFDDEDDEEAPISVFDVSLETWLNCLNLYNTATGVSANNPSNDKTGSGFDAKKTPFMRGKTGLEMIYAGKGHPLILEVHDPKVHSRCELSTFETNTVVITEMSFHPERAVGQVIMESKNLNEALLSIDPSSKNVSFEFFDDARHLMQPDINSGMPQTPCRPGRGMGDHSNAALTTLLDEGEGHEPYYDQLGKEMLRITAEGDHGSVELDFPNKNKVFESFSILLPSKHSYAYSNIQHCLRALRTSLKSSLRIDDQGMMSLQFLFPNRPLGEREVQSSEQLSRVENEGFVEMRMLSVIGDDDE